METASSAPRALKAGAERAGRWDVFCRVVDNLGDAGVSWRLARQLAREHGKRVRLLLDDPGVLAKLVPEIPADLDRGVFQDVEVCRWRDAFAPGDIADVVLETFGCDPPGEYVLAMAGRNPRPRWINLDYLSAEGWVEGSHGLPSPHPRLPLVKHFFFPGFTQRTGGLLREAGLLDRRQAFVAQPQVQAQFWRGLAGAIPPREALCLSLFAYPGARVESLFEALSQASAPVWCAVPEGPLAERLGGPVLERGQLRAFAVPFLAQDRYDELLWACDVNFVRGEDSFVRAQWAGKPFAWHIYPQEQGAHWVKLAAFLARYSEGLSRGDAGTVGALWEAWNRGEPMAAAWRRFEEALPRLRAHGADWCAKLALQRDLAAELVEFADHKLK